MYSVDLRKPDGRRLTLYARSPLPAGIQAPSPSATPVTATPHLRWHPLRGEWVAYASHRQDRTFLPPPEYNPLAVTRDPAAPTEVPPGPWDVAVFDNRFPALVQGAHDAPPLLVPTEPGRGACEVVVFTQDTQASLASLPLDHVDLVLQVWADRTRVLGQRPEIGYVLPFENRGVEVGVTLHHPHGQIYAYPLVPPIPERMTAQQKAWLDAHGTPLLAGLIAQEIQDGKRIVWKGAHAVAWVPAWARYPYEVWLAPVRAVPTLGELTEDERVDLARGLKTLLKTYDAMWERPFPYLMAWYQAPTDGQPHPEWHVHAELFPPYRTRDRLKYLAGTELGAGLFAMDALPEDKAAELRSVADRVVAQGAG